MTPIQPTTVLLTRISETNRSRDSGDVGKGAVPTKAGGAMQPFISGG